MVTKINKEKFIEACDGSGGIQSAIAQKLHVARSSVTEYLHRNPHMKKYVLQAVEDVGDMLENSVVMKAKNGDFKAQKFLLETRYKNRGYTIKQEVEHSGAMQNTITEITPDQLRERIEKIKNKRKE
jgi:hypothetical protein